jgi:F-type H+-transporting ATPase subunit gamma
VRFVLTAGMATLRQIRRRIRSVQNIQQVTRAMRMVAAARLRRAQENALAARPYARELARLIGRLSYGLEGYEHPLLQERPPQRHLLIALTSDRGLCGSFNANIIRATTRRLAELPPGTPLICVGKRGADFFERRRAPVLRAYRDAFHRLRHEDAAGLAQEATDRFSRAEFDRVELIFNEFRSAIHQVVRADTLLPIAVEGTVEGGVDPSWEYIYEPSRGAVLDALLPRHVVTQVWRAFLESYASEQGARMTAMENATKNAADMIDALTLERNRVRQTMITKEIAEIVGGAEAMKYS